MNALRELTGGDVEFERELIETFVASGDQVPGGDHRGAPGERLRHHGQARPCAEGRERQHSRPSAEPRGLEPGERGARQCGAARSTVWCAR